MFGFLEENSILCPHQSVCCLSDSYDTQLLSVTHGIYASFDESPTLQVKATS